MLARAGLVLTLGFTLAACDPAETADQLIRQTARSVIVPVLAETMPAPLAEAGADCIISAASSDELRGLAADFGNAAGTSTIANIAALAARPSVVNCFVTRSIPSLRI